MWKAPYSSIESQVHNIQMAEVEVNTEMGDVRVIKMTTAVDPGPVINPLNLEGQLEGGMDQGVGYALRAVSGSATCRLRRKRSRLPWPREL